MIVDRDTLSPANNLNEIHNVVRKMSIEIDIYAERVKQLRISYSSKYRALNDLVDIMHDRLCVLEEKEEEKKNNGKEVIAS